MNETVAKKKFSAAQLIKRFGVAGFSSAAVTALDGVTATFARRTYALTVTRTAGPSPLTRTL